MLMFMFHHMCSLTINVGVAPNIEKNTIGIGSRLLNKMGYIGYKHLEKVSDMLPCLHLSLLSPRKLFFDVGDVQTGLLEEKPTVECGEHIDDVAKLELETIVADGSVDDVEVFTPFTTMGLELASFVLLKQKSEPYHHPHKYKRILPRNQNPWNGGNYSLISLQRICEMMNHGPMPTIRTNFCWNDEWSYNRLNRLLQNSYKCVSLVVQPYSPPLSCRLITLEVVDQGLIVDNSQLSFGWDGFSTKSLPVSFIVDTS